MSETESLRRSVRGVVAEFSQQSNGAAPERAVENFLVDAWDHDRQAVTTTIDTLVDGGVLQRTIDERLVIGPEVAVDE